MEINKAHNVKCQGLQRVGLGRGLLRPRSLHAAGNPGGQQRRGVGMAQGEGSSCPWSLLAAMEWFLPKLGEIEKKGKTTHFPSIFLFFLFFPFKDAIFPSLPPFPFKEIGPQRIYQILDANSQSLFSTIFKFNSTNIFFRVDHFDTLFVYMERKNILFLPIPLVSSSGSALIMLLQQITTIWKIIIASTLILLKASKKNGALRLCIIKGKEKWMK